MKIFEKFEVETTTSDTSIFFLGRNKWKQMRRGYFVALYHSAGQRIMQFEEKQVSRIPGIGRSEFTELKNWN